jgi:hypothetical protein
MFYGPAFQTVKEMFLTSHYKTLRNDALASPERFASQPRWNASALIVSGTVRPGFTSAFSQRSAWLAVKDVIDNVFRDMVYSWLMFRPGR